MSAYVAAPTPTWGASSSELQREKPELKMQNEGPGGGDTSGPTRAVILGCKQQMLCFVVSFKSRTWVWGGTEVGDRSSEVTLGGQKHWQHHLCSDYFQGAHLAPRVSHGAPGETPRFSSWLLTPTPAEQGHGEKERGMKTLSITRVRCPDAQVQWLTTSQAALISSFQK